MNSDQILGLIDDIASTSSKLQKQALLEAGDCPELRRVLTAALDPLTTYGIAKLPERDDPNDESTFDHYTWKLIEGMAARTITGSEMQNEVWTEMNRLSAKSADLLGRILISDLKAGFGDNTVNKAFPGLIREFPYMRCSLPKKGKDGKDQLDKAEYPLVSQEKADAMFINVNHVAGGIVNLFTRAGNAFPNEAFGALIDEVRIAIPEDFQGHGELMVYRDGKLTTREDGNGVLNSVASGNPFGAGEVPFIMLWDAIPLSAVKPKGKYEVGYTKRLRTLIENMTGKGLTSLAIIPTRIVKSKADAMAHCAELMAQGKEGTIIKLRDAIWKDGTSTEQFKLKLEFEVDLEIIGVVPGDPNGKNADRAGSLACATSDNRLQVNVAIKGEKMRDEVDANRDEWVGKIMPVVANMIMKPSDSNPLHSLFLPRFSQSTWRLDKTVADTLARAFEIEAAAKGAAVALKEAA